MVIGMTQLNVSRVESNPVAMGILEGLLDCDSPTDGYTIMTYPLPSGVGAGWTYSQAKTALQMLREEGFLKVVKPGKAGKAKWVAYQTFWFSDAALEWWESREADEVKAIEAKYESLDQLARRVGDRRVKIGTKYLDETDLRKVLRLGMASGFLKVTLELTADGLEWLSGRDDVEGKA